MRHPQLISATVVVSAALALTACGSSGPSGFTARGRPPLNPSEWTMSKPSAEMADEAEALILSERSGIFTAAECTPATSLDGTGEFNFKCVAEGRGDEGQFKLDVVVFGSESGKPELGPIIRYTCGPVTDEDESQPRTC